ncbi:MAG: STAS domain-containing protein [Desulfuromonadales bacterium]|nr:STAS domain-containing protein [Desulfuromonadales bacterium]
MKVNISGTMAQLMGNWTRTEMTDRNIDSLATSLQQIKIAEGKNLRIDCGLLNEVDASGLQVLYILLRSFRFRGIDLQMVNPPRKLRKTLQGLLIKICYQEKTLSGRT